MGLSAAGRDCIGGGGRDGSAVAEGGGGGVEEEGGVGAASHIIAMPGSSPAERRICGVVGAIEVRLKSWREGRSFLMRREACVFASGADVNIRSLVLDVALL